MKLTSTDTYRHPEHLYQFSGKEFDRMHGLNWYDFHARMQGPVLQRFHTMDPLAEKYYSVSPYAHCLNNPVRYIDPNGMDIYIMMGDGRMVLALKTEDKTDQLYAFNYKENKMKSITVNDQGLLPQLSSSLSIDDKHYGTTSNKNDVFNVFKFAADNSDREWVVYNNENKYTIGTNHDTERAGPWMDYGIKKAPTESLHSHPDIGTTLREEGVSMGFVRKTHNSANPVDPSDWLTVRNDVESNKGKQTVSKYVYFPNSKRLYHVGYNGPLFIYNIGSNYKNLIQKTFK